MYDARNPKSVLYDNPGRWDGEGGKGGVQEGGDKCISNANSC